MKENISNLTFFKSKKLLLPGAASFCLMLVLTACAPLMIAPQSFPVSDSRTSLNAKAITNKSYRDLNFQPIMAAKQLKSRIDRNDSVFEFNGAKSFYEAYTLPSQSSDVRLNIKSWQDSHGEWKVDGFFYVYPEFIFLDADFQELGTTDGTPYSQESDFVKGRYLSIQRDITFQKPAKYIILKASNNYIGKLIERTAIVGGSQYSPNEAIATKTPFNFEGTVEFTILNIPKGQGSPLEKSKAVNSATAQAQQAQSELSPDQVADAAKKCKTGINDDNFDAVYKAAQNLRKTKHEADALTCFISLKNLKNIEPSSLKDLNFTIGVMYEMGEGTKPDLQEAKKYYGAAGIN